MKGTKIFKCPNWEPRPERGWEKLPPHRVVEAVDEADARDKLGIHYDHIEVCEVEDGDLELLVKELNELEERREEIEEILDVLDR